MRNYFTYYLVFFTCALYRFDHFSISSCFQVVSYALTLSHSTNKGHEAFCVAVRAYCTWLNALSKGTVAHIPGPMKRDPGNYIRFVIFLESQTFLIML